MIAVINSVAGYSIGKKIEFRAPILPLREHQSAPNYKKIINEAVEKYRQGQKGITMMPAFSRWIKNSKAEK